MHSQTNPPYVPRRGHSMNTVHAHAERCLTILRTPGSGCRCGRLCRQARRARPGTPGPWPSAAPPSGRNYITLTGGSTALEMTEPGVCAPKSQTLLGSLRAGDHLASRQRAKGEAAVCLLSALRRPSPALATQPSGRDRLGSCRALAALPPDSERSS